MFYFAIVVLYVYLGPHDSHLMQRFFLFPRCSLLFMHVFILKLKQASETII